MQGFRQGVGCDGCPSPKTSVADPFHFDMDPDTRIRFVK